MDIFNITFLNKLSTLVCAQKVHQEGLTKDVFKRLPVSIILYLTSYFLLRQLGITVAHTDTSSSEINSF